MPLSEQEQRLLDEMERNLYQGDAEYVATVGAVKGRPGYAVLALGSIVALVGVAVLVVGVALRQPVIGVLGFVGMFAGALVAISPPQRLRRTDGPLGDADRSGSDQVR